MAIKGILFDNDGTLIDTHDLILSSMTYATRKVLGRDECEEVLMAKVGQPLAVQVLDFTDDPEEQEEWLRVYREHNHAHHDASVKAFPGIVECLKELHEHGIVMGVVTSKLHALAWHGLEICGVAPYLDCCIGFDDCTLPKPNPEPVEIGLKQLGLAASECPYVGDSPFDIQAGKGAGCETIAVTWGMFSPEVLRAEEPTGICDTPAELAKLVLSLAQE